MRWLWRDKIWKSGRSGTILVRKLLGATQVRVGDTTQTSDDYTPAMWEFVFEKISSTHPLLEIRSVLLLGLGGGGCIAPLHKRFPTCTLTAVDFDRAMIAIAKELGLYHPYPFPKVLLGDARVVVPAIAESFELILLDLFEGAKLSQAVSDHKFLRILQEHLRPGGLLVVNLAHNKDVIDIIASQFENHVVWQFKGNTFGAFW